MSRLEVESGAGLKRYVVRLSEEERATLEATVSKGKRPASEILKARILLKADVSEAGEGWSDQRIVQALDTSLSTVYRTRQRLVEQGMDAGCSARSVSSPRSRVFSMAKPRPDWSRQSVHAVRAAGRLAACRGDGPAGCRRLRSDPQRPCGPALSPRQQDLSGVGQSQHPCDGLTV